MSKHEKNTFNERTNKFIMLDTEEQIKVREDALKSFTKLKEDVLNPNNNLVDTFMDAYLRNYEELKANIIFLEKERDAWKERAIKQVSK